MPRDFVGTLIADLQRRLEELETEKAAITRALRVLEGRKPRATRLDLRAALIQSIGACPGSRASFLALEFSVSTSTVMTHLRMLEQSGSIVKRGLGWDLVTPSRG